MLSTSFNTCGIVQSIESMFSPFIRQRQPVRFGRTP